MDKKNIQPEKLVAFFAQVVRNSKKNEYRQNDNAAKHISPVGLMCEKNWSAVNHEDELIDHLTYLGAQDWLMTINDEELHSALYKLRENDLALVYAMFVKGYSQADVAGFLGISQQSVSKRWKKISKNLKNLLK